MPRFPKDYSYDHANPFALILKGEIPCSKVYEDEAVLAFNDINPKQAVHVLVIPKKPYICYSDFLDQAPAAEIKAFFTGVRETAKQLGLTQYTLVTNNGEAAGQVVFHFHVHLLANAPTEKS